MHVQGDTPNADLQDYRVRRSRRARFRNGPCAAPEKKDIKLGVGGGAALYYLPLALTEKLGHFKEQGLNVEVSDFKGGSQSLTALVGGSADVVTGAYEHTLRMQAKGQDILAVIELGRYPGIALASRPTAPTRSRPSPTSRAPRSASPRPAPPPT